jgi:hypothetical protein
LTNGDAPPGIGTLMVGGVAPLVNGDNGGWTGTEPLSLVRQWEVIPTFIFCCFLLDL